MNIDLGATSRVAENNNGRLGVLLELLADRFWKEKDVALEICSPSDADLQKLYLGQEVQIQLKVTQASWQSTYNTVIPDTWGSLERPGKWSVESDSDVTGLSIGETTGILVCPRVTKRINITITFVDNSGKNLQTHLTLGAYKIWGTGIGSNMKLLITKYGYLVDDTEVIDASTDYYDLAYRLEVESGNYGNLLLDSGDSETGYLEFDDGTYIAF